MLGGECEGAKAADHRLSEKLVVGLGNPGRRYARTRHNVGFMVLAALKRRWRADAGRKAFCGLVTEARPERPEAGKRRVRLLAPLTYMNLSGESVRSLAGFYKVAHENMLIVLDDMALAPGRLRAREGGTAGGHKGLGDVLAALGTEMVPRLRIGIGPPPEAMDPTAFVLRRFEPDEEEKIERAVQLAAEAVEEWAFNGINSVMNRYNKRADQ